MSNIWRALCLTFIILSFFTNSSFTKKKTGLSKSDRKRLQILNILLSKHLENLNSTERKSDDAAEVERVVQFLQNVEETPEKEHVDSPTPNYLWAGLSTLSEFVTKLLTSPSLMNNMIQPAIRMMDSALASTTDETRCPTCPPETCTNLELSQLSGTWAMPSVLLYSERLTLDNSTESDTIKLAIKQLNRPSMQSAMCLRTEVTVHNLNECEFTVDVYALGTMVESMNYNWHSPTRNGRMNYTHVSGTKNKMVDELVVLDVNPDEHIALAACSGGVAVGAVILARKNTLPASHEFIWDNILRQIGNHPSDLKRIWHKLGTKCVT
ncbi:hypothetical protein B566_EDAN001378 [Ephemera danica]|nr:hypothetical protein B566_EDAN001378 [Ephemera danica]